MIVPASVWLTLRSWDWQGTALRSANEPDRKLCRCRVGCGEADGTVKRCTMYAHWEATASILLRFAIFGRLFRFVFLVASPTIKGFDCIPSIPSATQVFFVLPASLHLILMQQSIALYRLLLPTWWVEISVGASTLSSYALYIP